jgi:hypothetical protein
MIRDHEDGPAGSRREHFDEWTLKVGGTEEDRASEVAYAAFERWAAEESRRLEAEDFSIHFHVWDQASFLALILHCRERFQNFEIEASAQCTLEFVIVLRKRGEWPEPAAPVEPPEAVEGPAVERRQPGSLAQRLRGALRGNGDQP